MAFYNPYSYTDSPYGAPTVRDGWGVQYPQNAPVQQGGVIPVRSEADARNYPVAPGNSIVFKDENAPYIYVKTMGFSQFDSPSFEKYRLQKEEPSPAQGDAYAMRSELAMLAAKINDIDAKLKAIKGGADDE